MAILSNTLLYVCLFNLTIISIIVPPFGVFMVILLFILGMLLFFLHIAMVILSLPFNLLGWIFGLLIGKEKKKEKGKRVRWKEEVKDTTYRDGKRFVKEEWMVEDGDDKLEGLAFS